MIDEILLLWKTPLPNCSNVPKPGLTMNYYFRRISAHLASITFVLLAVSCEKNASKGTQDPATSGDPGPVEHIDAAERVAAAKLVPTLDPVQNDIRIFKAEIRGAFDERKFDLLEKTAAELRQSKALFGEGSWKLKIFYDALEERFNQGQDFWLTDIKTYEAWEKSYPHSLARRIGSIKLLTAYAWYARGSGYARDVTEENHRLFQVRLEMAAKVFAETRDLPEKDPCCQLAAMTIALGQGWSKARFDALLTEATALDPTFWHIHPMRCYSLLPRWYGEEGEWEAYAEKASQQSGGLGDEAYARIVMSMNSHYGNTFRESKASWPKTKTGLAILKTKFPASLEFPSQIARLATMGDDQVLAKSAFAEIGDRFLESVWKKPERLVHFRTWAETGKW